MDERYQLIYRFNIVDLRSVEVGAEGWAQTRISSKWKDMALLSDLVCSVFETFVFSHVYIV